MAAGDLFPAVADRHRQKALEWYYENRDRVRQRNHDKRDEIRAYQKSYYENVLRNRRMEAKQGKVVTKPRKPKALPTNATDISGSSVATPTTSPGVKSIVRWLGQTTLSFE